MWFFVILLFVGAILQFGDSFFYFCLFGILLFFANWLLNKLFKPEEMIGEKERVVFVIVKAIVFILVWFWFW